MGSQSMHAAVLAAPGCIRVVEVRIPEPLPEQVRVRLKGCGVCASNLSPWEGKPWFTYPMAAGALGHEGWGHVDSVGEAVSGWHTGDVVAMLSNHAYAEYDVCDAASVVRLPKALIDRPFPGEPLGCAINIFRRCAIKPGECVAIVGIGFLGALLCRLASNAGGNVVAIGRRPFALALASDAGAKTTLVMDDHWKVVEHVQRLTDGRMCDVVIEAVGKQRPLDLASDLTKEMGRLIIAGYHQDGLRQVNMQQWNWRGLDVINAHEREQQIYINGMRRAAEEVAIGALDPTPLMTHTFGLEQLGDALDMTRDRPDGFMKASIVMR